MHATLGSTATFNCSVTTGTVAWIVNNGSLLSSPDIFTSIVGHVSYLYIPAVEQYNNTNVTSANVIFRGDILYSDPVVLRVQG